MGKTKKISDLKYTIKYIIDKGDKEICETYTIDSIG